MRRLLASALVLGAAPAVAAEWDLIHESSTTVGGTPRGLAYGRGSVWYSARETPRIYELDPLTGQVRSAFSTERPIGALAWDDANVLILAATYDLAQARLFEYDLAGNKVREGDLYTDVSIESAPNHIDGLELVGGEIWYSTDVGKVVYVADRATLGLVRTIPIEDGYLTGHARGGNCLFSGRVPTTSYELVRTDLDGNVLSRASTSVIGGEPSPIEFPPEDITFDADHFPVPVIWVNVAWLPRAGNPLWAVEVDGCGEVCTSPPLPLGAGNTLLGVRRGATAEYSWNGIGALDWRVLVEGAKLPGAQAAVVRFPMAWSTGIAAAPFPLAYLVVKSYNCLGQEEP